MRLVGIMVALQHLTVVIQQREEPQAGVLVVVLEEQEHQHHSSHSIQQVPGRLHIPDVPHQPRELRDLDMVLEVEVLETIGICLARDSLPVILQTQIPLYMAHTVPD